jgi:hypothetical protein
MDNLKTVEVQTKGLEVQSGTNEIQTIGTGSDPKFESGGAGEMDLVLRMDDYLIIKFVPYIILYYIIVLM